MQESLKNDKTRNKIDGYFKKENFSNDLGTVFEVQIKDRNELYKVLSDKEQFGKIFKLNLDE